MIVALRTTLSVVFVALACWLGTATPTAATAAPSAAADCTLDLGNALAVRESAAAVTDVFSGKVLEVQAETTVGAGDDKADQGGSKTQSPPNRDRSVRWEQTVVVDLAFQGDHQSRERLVVMTRPTAEGGLGRLDKGATYLFFVSGNERTAALEAETCSGTQKLPQGLSSHLRDAIRKALAEPETDGAPLDYTLSAPDDGVRSTPSLGRLVAPGAAVALIGVLGLLLLVRIGSRRA